MDLDLRCRFGVSNLLIVVDVVAFVLRGLRFVTGKGSLVFGGLAWGE